MRQIKFRAWNTVNKTWENDFVVSKDGHIVNECMWQLDPQKVILMQFTGCLDINNKEIYEGDLIQHPKAPGFVYEVFFGLENHSFGDRYIKGWVLWGTNGLTSSLYKVEQNNLEVIGNIYENPDLAKKGFIK